MAEFPCLPLFTDAYLGDTTHLTTVEHGAYLLLLITQWRAHGCILPNDDKMLARYTKMSPREWAAVKPILIEFFTVTPSSWRQKRLSDEKKFVETKRKQNIEAGRVSALKRKERHSTDVITDAPTEGQREPNQPLTLNPTLKKELNNTGIKDTPALLGAEAGAVTVQPSLESAVELEAAAVMWNEMAGRNNLPKCQSLNKTRRSNLKNRLKEIGGLDGWQLALEKVEQSTFLKGGSASGWVADFNFMLQQKSLTKIMEGSYDDRKSISPKNKSAVDSLAAGFDSALDMLEMAERNGGNGGQ